jgi:hypothetical protein
MPNSICIGRGKEGNGCSSVCYKEEIICSLCKRLPNDKIKPVCSGPGKNGQGCDKICNKGLICSLCKRLPKDKINCKCGGEVRGTGKTECWDCSQKAGSCVKGANFKVLTVRET